ncbi:MAG: cell division protein FtsL [Hyphomicrobiaceae bacterium]
MLRFLMFGAITAALGSVFVFYAVNYKTRRIEAKVRLDQRQQERLLRDIAVLRAERAYVGRAERIAAFARKLGMRPLNGKQIVQREGLRAKHNNK